MKPEKMVRELWVAVGDDPPAAQVDDIESQWIFLLGKIAATRMRLRTFDNAIAEMEQQMGVRG